MSTKAVKKTIEQYEAIIKECHNLFVGKNKDYGMSWTWYRSESISHQIMIKAKRIRELETKKARISDSIASEYMGIINYCLMKLVIMYFKGDIELVAENAIEHYEKQASIAEELMTSKNHDYGEAWREMPLSVIIDFILTRMQRIINIESNSIILEFSEGMPSVIYDVINYAVFSLILIREKEKSLKKDTSKEVTNKI